MSTYISHMCLKILGIWACFFLFTFFKEYTTCNTKSLSYIYATTLTNYRYAFLITLPIRFLPCESKINLICLCSSLKLARSGVRNRKKKWIRLKVYCETNRNTTCKRWIFMYQIHWPSYRFLISHSNAHN